MNDKWISDLDKDFIQVINLSFIHIYHFGMLKCVNYREALTDLCLSFLLLIVSDICLFFFRHLTKCEWLIDIVIIFLGLVG